MKNKKLAKYLFGTQNPTDPWDRYEQIRLGRISEDPGQIEDPNTALMDNSIRSARAELDSNKGINQALDVFGTLALNQGVSMMSGGISEKLKGLINKQNMAYGGKVKSKMVEIEGGETIEKPDGNLFEGFGPNHDKGGLKILLEEGDVVSSKRIKDKKGSMAKKSKMRKKEEEKLEKLLEKNSTDKLLKNTRERVLETNEKEKKQDLMLQSLIGAVAGDSGEEKANGSSILDIFRRLNGGKGDDASLYGASEIDYSTLGDKKFGDIDASLGGANEINYSNLDMSKKFGPQEGDAYPVGGIGTPKSKEGSEYVRGGIGTPKEDNPMKLLSDLLSGESNLPTGGDLLGLFAQYKGATEPMKNTLRNRAGDTPNINAFKDYGKDGIKAIQSGKNYIEQSREDAEEDIRVSSRAARERARKSSRSVNTNRALDIATESNANDAKDKIRTAFNNQMLQLIGQEAQAENLQDRFVMEGEQNRDLADRKDRDNFFSNMAQDIAAKFENIQGIGNNLNSIKKRGDSAERIRAIVEASKYSNSLRELLETFLKINQGDVKVSNKAT